MSSLPSTDHLANRTEYSSRHDPNSNTPPPSAHEHDTTPEFKFTLNQNYALTWPATRSTSHQPSEGSEMTILGGIYDGSMFDNASSVTLQDEFPWHEVGVNKYTQRIPSTIAPALLQGVSDISPSSRSSLDRAEGEVDEDTSDPGDILPRYSTTQKGKWKAQTDDDGMHASHLVRSPSPQFHFDSIYNPVEDWVVHSRPILQEYADRQTSLPLGRRLEVSIDEPPQFILGAIQLLANRDRRDSTDRSRQLGPQLIENFVDIDRWTKEYLRSRHGTQLVDSDVSTLLTIVMNNFYDGQVQLIDRLVEFALENMRFCGRSSLGVEDFAFGFDFKMSQDLPFYVETSSQIREPLPIRAVEVRPTLEPVTTSSGRQVKPTKRAQASSEQTHKNAKEKRNKGKNTPQVNDKQATTSSALAARQKKSSVQPSSDRVVQVTPLPPQVEPRVTALTKHRPIRPSNLGLPPILPGSLSTPANALSRSNDSSQSKPSSSTSTGSPKVSNSLGSNLAVRSSPRLKIILPAPSLPASAVRVTGESAPTSSNTKSSTSQVVAPANAMRTTNRECRTSRSGGIRTRGPRNGRGRGRGRERANESSNPNVETSGVAVDSAKAVFSSPVAHPTPVRNAVDRISSRTRPRTSDGIGTCHDGPSMSQRTQTAEPLLLLTDPGHPQGKKRKLDDSED